MALADAPSTARSVVRTPYFRSLKWQEAKWGYIFISPNLLLFLMFTLFPVFASFYYSLNDWNIHMPMQFVGHAKLTPSYWLIPSSNKCW